VPVAALVWAATELVLVPVSASTLVARVVLAVPVVLVALGSGGMAAVVKPLVMCTTTAI